MAYALPASEPAKITAGDTITWKKSLSDFPAGDGWELSYALVKDGAQILIPSTGDGDNHLVSIPSSTSKDYAADVYQWQSYAAKGAERHKVGSGTIEILPDFSAQTNGYDGRSAVKKILDALEATLIGKASKDQLSMRLPGDGRSIERIPPSELLVWRDKMKLEYQNEVKAERLAQGLGTKGKIRLRFKD